MVLSVLYASTPTFYRKVGYEPAGWAVEWKVDPDYLAAPMPQDCAFVRVEKDDVIVRELYARWAAQHNGPLTRSDEFWRRHLDPPKHKRHIYERHDGTQRVADVVTSTLRATQAAKALLHQHRSGSAHIQWPGSFDDPLRMTIEENASRVTHPAEWMLRIVNVEAALSQRGYRRVHCELHLDVRDEAVSDNAGRYVLSIGGGEPTVQRGGAGRITLDIRALAAIFTGHCTPEAMRACGLLDGPDDDLAAMALAFSGPAPFMLDRF
jgi:predicted acetyltransferase